jgi:hypothetical protein
MAVLEGVVSGSTAEVAVASGSALHVTSKPTPVGALGHYRTSHRTVLVNTQAANSRLFEIRNIHASNILIVHAIRIEWIQTAAHTAAIMDSIDVYRCTSFSAVDTTNTVTPTMSKLRASYATLVDGTDLAIRGVTVAGAAAGMTGGTLTKDTAPQKQLGQFLLAAVPTANTIMPIVLAWTPDVAAGEAPPQYVQNEGFIIENRVLLGAAAGSAVSIDVEFAVASAY